MSFIQLRRMLVANIPLQPPHPYRLRLASAFVIHATSPSPFFQVLRATPCAKTSLSLYVLCFLFKLPHPISFLGLHRSPVRRRAQTRRLRTPPTYPSIPVCLFQISSPIYPKNLNDSQLSNFESLSPWEQVGDGAPAPRPDNLKPLPPPPKKEEAKKQ